MNKKIQKPTKEQIKSINDDITIIDDSIYNPKLWDKADKKQNSVKPKYGIPPKLPRK